MTLSSTELEVQRCRSLTKQGRFAEALAAAAEILREMPENRDALYLAALGRRGLNRIPEALATLDRLENLAPGFSRLHQERGHCYVALRDAPRAIEALLRGVKINPALPGSWRMLESLYRFAGDADRAEVAARHVAWLEQLPAPVVQATGLYSDGEFAAAEAIVGEFLLAHGNHVEAMRLLAKIRIARDMLDDAESLLSALLALVPDYAAARHDYALVLIERQTYQRAREQAALLLEAEPDSCPYRALYAAACAGLGDHQRAIPVYQSLLTDMPQAADLYLSLAHEHKAAGRRVEAIETYRMAAAVRPGYGEAYWSLANLKTYRFSDDEISRMSTAESAAQTPDEDRCPLCFALGKAHEDRGDYARSWHYYSRGNALRRAASRYRPEIIERIITLQKQVCTAEFFQARTRFGAADADPIFIVGLPRAGSTLIDQILASHSQVEGTQELSDIPRMVLGLQGPQPDMDSRYPAALGAMSAEDMRALGSKYLADTRIYRTGKRRFVDKMPNNFRHVGLIHLMLPNARIIDARREPMACCFGNFKQLFANGHEFTYSLKDLARYYRSYVELMDHWDRVLPGRVLRIRYEDVVEDLEANVHRILDFCGLPFESACLDFHKTERSIRTASSEQVRLPIFHDGLQQWRRYLPWLGPLQEALAA